jgi:hypothetical protein
VIGRLSDYADPESPRPYWNKIREIQDNLPKKDLLVRCVNTDDLNGANNGLHYGKEGYAELGKRFAAAAIELIKNPRQATPAASDKAK